MTIFMPQEVTLKDGRLAWIRAATPRDAASAWEVERAIVATGMGVVRTLDTFPDQEAFEEDYRLALKLGFVGRKGASLVAQLDEGPLLGTATLKRLGPNLIDHVALLSVGVHPRWQGLGLGRLLMQGLLDWASPGAGSGPDGVLRLELYVRADNAPAIALYHSLGFVTEGRRRAFLRLPDGTLVDDLVMGRLLPP